MCKKKQFYNKKKIIKMIAPGSLSNVIKIKVHIFNGILTLINEPNKLIAKIITSAINTDLTNHFKNFIILTHCIIWDNGS